MLQLAQKRFMHDLKTTVSWNCKMIMEILSDTLQLSYLVIKWTNMSNQKMWQHKIPEQEYDPNDKLQVYYKTVQDARNTLEPLNETIDEATLICHGLNQFKEHNINFKLDVKNMETITTGRQNMEKIQIPFHKGNQ